MFKIKKNIIFFLSIVILITNCGYTPQYAKKNLDFSLDLINISGDRDFNNALKSKLNAYNNNKEKNFKIESKSKYEKKITLKNSSGTAKEYELKITVSFNITHENEQKDLKMVETFKMQKIDDAFEESNYEKSIKSNFAENITERLIDYLFLMR